MMLRPEDYERENKQHRRSTRVMTKTKLPTQHKSSTHSCSQCERKDAMKYTISAKEVRWLCPDCIAKYLRRNNKEKPNFIKASVLQK